MQNIPSLWLEGQNPQGLDSFERIVDNLISNQRVSRYAYCLFYSSWEMYPRHAYFLENLYDDSESGPQDLDWDEIHLRNFKCSIDTRLRSFYFKLFHNAIIAFHDVCSRQKEKILLIPFYLRNLLKT